MKASVNYTVLKLILFCIPLTFVACEAPSASNAAAVDDTVDVVDVVDIVDEVVEQATARISGSVKLSSSVSGTNKPGILVQKSSAASLRAKPTAERGVLVTRKPSINSSLSAVPLMNVALPVGNAFVYLYDAENPEWTAPVAQDVTNSDGDYAFEDYGCTVNVSSSDCVADAASNDNAYVDGEPLAQGIYTMLIYKPSTFDPILGVTTDPIVSVLPAFKADAADFAVAEAEAEVSDASPSVVTMFGQKKNTDGTDSWGTSGLNIPANASIQVAFDMAMSRGSIGNISVDLAGNAVTGKWTLSPDWLNATFTPSSAFAAGAYTVTVPSSTVNVYSNAMGFKALGYFTAVAVDATAPTVSLTSPVGATAISATSPIRLTANESLNINTLRIASTPSIGDFPSVVLVDQAAGAYVYEVKTTQSLTLSTDYVLTFSGIADNAGNSSADLSKSFSTQSAGSAEGVDATAGSETQNAQVAISDIFAKWVLAVNERNAASIQALMSGSFVFEYSVQAEDGYRSDDINRNGRLSLNEFMNMIEDGMVHWEVCETTVTGDIVGNVDLASADSGSFEFILAMESIDQSQDCTEGDEESLFATVKNINGQWKLARMSEGFDNRDTPLAPQELIEAQLYETADNIEGETLVPNWSTLTHFAGDQSPFTFKFGHVSGVETYILLLANIRDPEALGFALAISANRLACGDDNQCSAADGDALQLTVPDALGAEGMPAGAVVISEFFDFDDQRDWGIENPGETFMWEIIGLGSIAPPQFDASTPPTVVELIRDISAVSAVKRFQNPGEFVRLGVAVESVLDDQVTPISLLEYDIYDGGYDAGAANFIAVTITTPIPDGVTDLTLLDDGSLYVNSNIGGAEYPVVFDTDNLDGSVSGSTVIELFNGWTWVEASNGMSLYEQFQVSTEGGVMPVVQLDVLTGIADTATTPVYYDLEPNQWNFVDASSDGVDSANNSLASGIDQIDVIWTIQSGDGLGNSFDVDDVLDMLVAQNCSFSSGWASLSINVWNSQGAYANLNYCDNQGNVSGDIIISGSAISLLTTLDVYEDDNWISLDIYGDAGANDFYQTSSSFGLYTDAGTLYVAPIALVSLTTDIGTPDENGNWGQGSDWDATAVTIDESGIAVDQLTILVDFANPVSPMAYGGSDGNCCTDAALQLVSGTTYSTVITLYQGFNWLSIEDGDGNWYNLNIYTENGAVMPKPEFLTANGVAIPEPADQFSTVEVVVDQCVLSLTGTTPYNTERLNIGWSGGNNNQGFNEGQNIFLGDPLGDVTLLKDWTATFQLISGANTYNNVNLWDETNQTSNYINVSTTAVGCVYAEPVLTIDGFRGTGNATELVSLDGSTYGLDDGNSGLLPLTDTDAYVYGTSSIPGRQIGVHAYLCGQEVKFGAKASNQANGAGSYNWLVEVELFDPDVNVGNEFYQYLDVSDGFSSGNFTLLSDSNNVPVPPMSLTLPAGLVDTTAYGCGYAEWDGTSLTTALVDLMIEGQTNNAQAFNSFGQAYNSSGWVDFEIDAGGNFSFPVTLYDGYNSVQVDDGHGGNFGVDIVTANGQLRPQFLTIRNPIHNDDSYAVSADETLTVSGDFANFSPDFLYGHASYCVPDGQGDCLYQSVSYDSDLLVANEWGDLPMDFDAGDIDFAFDLALPMAAIDVYIDVSGCGPEGCHGHSISVNDGDKDDGDNYYKPGSTASSLSRYQHRQARH